MSDKPTIRALLEDQSTASYSLGVMHVERHNRDSIIYRLDLQVLRNQPVKGWVGTTCTPADLIENVLKVRLNRWFHRRIASVPPGEQRTRSHHQRSSR
jgi:hypothetical protein